MESRKMALMDLFSGQQWRSRHREQTYRHGERGGEGEMCGKSNMETYITMCNTDSQREFAVWLRTQQGFCINLEGWEGVGDGREVQREGIYVYLWLIRLRFDRKQSSVKQLSFNKK